MSKKRHEEHEEHVDESWLVPYADVLTLLLALFIVLFATSQTDQAKLEQMAESFQNAFGAGSGILESGVSIVPAPLVNVPSEAPPGDPASREEKQLASLKVQLEQYIDSQGLSDQLEIQLTEEGLIIQIKDKLLFRQGSAEVLAAAKPIANLVAKVVGALDQQVVVSGHTDNIPSNGAEFPSNWDLSSKRAVNFMKFVLAENPSLKQERFQAVGFSEFRPVSLNITEEGRAKNRRVEVLILRTYHNMKSDVRIR